MGGKLTKLKISTRTSYNFQKASTFSRNGRDDSISSRYTSNINGDPSSTNASSPGSARDDSSPSQNLSGKNGDPSSTNGRENEEFFIIQQRIGKDWFNLAIRLLRYDEVEAIQVNCTAYGVERMAYESLTKWKQKNPDVKTVPFLTDHLVEIGRTDIATEIKHRILKDDQHRNTTHNDDLIKQDETENESLFPGKKSQKKGSLTLLETTQIKLKEGYQNLCLQGLPWMRDIRITLADYYVTLTMIQQTKRGEDLPEETREIHEIFDTKETAKQPSRILVEGQAGFGKTTFASKLCFDYANSENYLNKFDLVLVLPLRYFTGELKELLKRASRFCEENVEGLFEIINNKEVNTLLICDGYDEVANECIPKLLPLIRGDIFPHLTVIITSRPAQFSSHSYKVDRFGISDDVTIDEKLFNKRIKILGIKNEQIPEFLQKHFPHLSDQDQISVVEQLYNMAGNELVTENDFQCPLFLLMICLLLTEDNKQIKWSWHTRTDLYKQVMNFVIRRYAAKSGCNSPGSIDLYSMNKMENCEFKALMIQFGQFSLEALRRNQLSFSEDDILGPDNNRDSRILHLGLLTKSVSIKGFRETIRYEPVHKSIMEFCSAFFLWDKFKNGPIMEWTKDVCYVRPTSDNYSSLLFPFLTGLMGEEADVLYTQLVPYAAEYGVNFSCFQPSLSETELTSSFLSAFRPLIPANILLNRAVPGFGSAHFTKIIPFGVACMKVKLICLWAQLPYSFQEDINVHRLSLLMGASLASCMKNLNCKVSCRNLFCSFIAENPSSKEWHDLQSLLACIKYQRISFQFNESDSFLLPLFLSAVTTGFLREAKLCFIRINLHMTSKCHLISQADLIKNERIKGLWIEIKPSPVSVSSHPECKADCESCVLSLQQCLDYLVACASKSTYLTYFVFRNATGTTLSLDLSLLCNNGQKSWKCVWLELVQIKCTEQVQNSTFKIQHLQAHGTELPESVCNFLQSCRMKSFMCNKAFMAHNTMSCFCSEHLTEVYLLLDESIFDLEFFTRLSQVTKLQILSFELTPFHYRFFPISVENWLLTSLNHSFNLKGIEINTVEDNPELALDLVQVIGKMLNPLSPVTSYSASESTKGKQFKLQYLMLCTSLEPEPADISSSECENLTCFFSLALNMKDSLRNILLPRLDISVYGRRAFECMPKLKPGFTSIYEIFQPGEGFLVTYEAHGMRKADSVRERHRMKFRTTPNDVLSITFNKS